MLTALIVLPAVAALMVYPARPLVARWVAVLAAVADLALATGALTAPPESVPWIPTLGLGYDLKVDGLAYFLVVLAPLVTALALLATSPRLARLNEYSALMLALLAALQGVFLAGNLGLFYIFWEIMVLPAFFLVGRWGGDAGRRAAVKFLLYTLAGSLAMLLAVVTVAFSASPPSFSFETLSQADLSEGAQLALVVFFFLGFAVKVPLLPLHGWQADTYEAAPAPAAALIAAVMSKAGVYGFLRVSLALFPIGMAKAAPYLGALALLTVLYGTLCALGQQRMRRVLAYSSLAHVGMMMLAVFHLEPSALEGATLQMLAHGLTTAALFLLLGMLEDRDVPGDLSRVGGLAGPMPAFSLLLLLFAMASLGLPGLCSFPAELLMLYGVYQINPVSALMAMLGLVGAAWYMLRFFHRIANGSLRMDALKDLSWTEIGVLVPLALLVVWIGLNPAPWAGLAGPVLQDMLGGVP
ncbi:MAG: NADH-quinone oxidoreductase subunit M [Candidatus Eremiobacterota bacterium]